MHRIDHATKDEDLHGAGKDGFTEGDPQTAVPATVVTEDWLNDVQENIARAIEDADGGNTALSKGNHEQLKNVIQFQQEYWSAAQTITSAGSLTLPHGFDTAPKLVQCYLKCVTAEAGYSIDDQVIINPAGNDPAGAANRGVALVIDTTDIYVRFGSDGVVFSVMHKTTGVATSLTNANWSLFVRAWR